MANKILDAHEALWAVVEAAYPAADRHRNPAGHKKPAPRTAGDLAAYVAQTDDPEAEVLAVMTGPVYDLEVCPLVLFAFAGKTKDERQAAAWAAVDLLRAALADDPSLSGAVDYADLEHATPVDAADTDWMSGGLEVGVRLLFSAPTRAG